MAGGLEGKFDVNIGELVRIKGVNGDGASIEVAGYVVLISDSRVRLSHENPNKASIKFISGDKNYNLADFDIYDILN